MWNFSASIQIYVQQMKLSPCRTFLIYGIWVCITTYLYMLASYQIIVTCWMNICTINTNRHPPCFSGLYHKNNMELSKPDPWISMHWTQASFNFPDLDSEIERKHHVNSSICFSPNSCYPTKPWTDVEQCVFHTNCY